MRTIYEAEDQVDAQRVVHLLGQEGIPAHVQGSYLLGAVGEIPAGGLVNVWVADADEVRAREILAEDGPPEPIEDDQSTSPRPVAIAAAHSRPGWFVVLVFLAVGTATGYFFGALQAMPTEVDDLDWNGDGTVDSHYDYGPGDRLLRIRNDRNTDGKIDEIVETPSAPESVSKLDDDFDGRFEGQVWFEGGQPRATELDVDGDGFAEWRWEYVNGVVRSARLREPIRGAVIKTQDYQAGFVSRESYDSDGDGTLERVRVYDVNGEFVQEP